MRHRNKLFKSGNGTSRSSSKCGGGGKSWRDVVEVAAEVKLIIWPIPGSLCTPGGWKSDTLVAFQGCGKESQELMGELKSLLGHRKVLSHSMVLMVRCAKVIYLIR